MTRWMDADEFAASLCGSCRYYQGLLEDGRKREKKLLEREKKLLEREKKLLERVEHLRSILRRIHEDAYLVNEDTEVWIRTSLGLPLGDEDDA